MMRENGFKENLLLFPCDGQIKEQMLLPLSHKKSEIKESSVNVQILTCSSPKGRGTEIVAVIQSFINS